MRHFSLFPRLGVATLVPGLLLMGIFAAMVLRFRAELREEIHQKIFERDAAVLLPFALQQLEENETPGGGTAKSVEELLGALLKSGKQKTMLAVSIFDADGNPIRSVPESLLFADLPIDDYLQLREFKPISRYHPAFRLELYFSHMDAKAGPAPVLEVLLPLRARDGNSILGFAQYLIDGRSLAAELALIDRRVNRQTAATLAIGLILAGVIVLAAYFGLRRAERIVGERNERLTRVNFELTLSAKASAIGQITSHLIHGLQGPVAGLRAVMDGREMDSSMRAVDWKSAVNYTDRMQVMIQETVALLADTGAHTSYELTGFEIAEIIRSRNAAAAAEHGINFYVEGGFTDPIDGHRASLLCLIGNNLIQNSIEATEAEKSITVSLTRDRGSILLAVVDQGSGITDELRPSLFEPGRSGRSGGSGLGLAISQLLARQVGAQLSLEYSTPNGTAFRLTVPLTESF